MEDQSELDGPFGDASSDDHDPIEGIVGRMTVEEARQSLKDAKLAEQAKETELTKVHDGEMSAD